MAKLEFETGSSVTIRGEFRTPKTAIPPSVLTDPSIVTLTIQRPDKTLDTRIYGVSGVTRVSAGIYTASLLLSQQGTYHWRWKAESGSDAGVITGSLDSVLEPNF